LTLEAGAWGSSTTTSGSRARKRASTYAATTFPGYWASFDPQRPRKAVAFVFDLGKATHPFITPADPDAFEAAVSAHTGPFTTPPPGEPGPLI